MKQLYRTYSPASVLAAILLAGVLFVGSASETSAQPFSVKQGGITFRVENNPVLSKLHQLDSIFSRHDQKFNMAITSWIFPLAPAYVDTLISYSMKGYEVMDHTPTHQTQYFNILNPADTALFIGKPGVHHVTATRVCLAYSAVDTSQSHNEGLVDLFGNMVISHNPGEFGNLTGNPYFFALYLNTINRVCLWYDRMAVNPNDPDTVFIRSLWEEPLSFPTTYNLQYHKLTQVNVLMQPEAIRLLGQRSLDLFDQNNIPRPTSWIHPSGQMPMLDGYQIKGTLGDSLDYTAGSNYINESYLCYNEYNPYQIRQFGMQHNLISIANHTLEWNKKRIANAIAKHYLSVDVTTLEGVLGGWNSYLLRLDSLLGWCGEHDIPVGTYSQWKRWLYDSIPIRVIDIFPELNVDIDENNYPDGFDQDSSIMGQYITTDGVPESGGCSFVLTEAGTFCQITQLAGLEKGDNIVTLYVKNVGPDSSLVKATFTFPETGNVQELEFVADTSIWTMKTGMVTVPVSASIMNVSILRTDTMPDTLKISGIGFRSAGFLNRSAYPHQVVARNEQFERINLYSLVIDTIYNPTTISWWVKGADTMTFRDLTSENMLPLKPRSFWIGSDTAWLMAMSQDGLKDSCRLSFTSTPMIGACPGLPLTITLLDTLENDFIQWTTFPFDSTISNPNIYNPSANPSVSTLYKVTAINPQGPIYYDSLFVVRFPVPHPYLPPDTNICKGDSLTLTASGGVYYLWNTGDTTASIRVGPQITTLYSVIAVNEKGCSDTASTVISVIPSPEVRIWGLWPAYCEYDGSSTVFMEPTGGMLYGTGLVGDLFYPDIANLGLNTITYYYADSTGCSNSDTITVHVYPKPSILPQPQDTIVCADKSITLLAGSGNSSYLWSNGVASSVVVLDTTGIGLGDYMIWVYVTKNGCVNIDTAFITFIRCNIGIDDLSVEQTYRIYPNPARESVTIESLLVFDPEFSLEIFDLRGETLIRELNNSFRKEVALDGISPGIYLLQIRNKTGTYYFRLVHQ
ncbi:MAG: T9SS type A sorting domain-containing protein [Bacteroidales bacterium]|nr:T9SS type A sorting domain-containing protein [Bacteroidales bacterium]